MAVRLDDSWGRLPATFFQEVAPVSVRDPTLLAYNADLARELGFDDDEYQRQQLAQLFSGNELLPGSRPKAMAYAGHQFGHFAGQLGDGRAHLLGDVLSPTGQRYDLQLKGSGPTRFSRGGDGRAGLGPVLREYLVSEAMHALGVPTTRCLAAVATGESIQRETRLPGAIVTRVASSHLRVGTFQYAARFAEQKDLEALVAWALWRHPPKEDRVADADSPALLLLAEAIAAQARLVAHWMSLGFVHGVMNTDNCALSGETIDYGPCAFLDGFAPEHTFSSIDRHGRYAWKEQPSIAHFNLTRLAETLLPLIDPDEARAVTLATEALEHFQFCFDTTLGSLWRAKLGLDDATDPGPLVAELLGLMSAQRADFTLSCRRLADATAEQQPRLFLELFDNQGGARAFLEHHTQALKPRLAQNGGGQHSGERNSGGPDSSSGGTAAAQQEIGASMRAASPLFIPRNHRVEEALSAATQGDISPFRRLLRVGARPFDEQPGEEDLVTPPGDEQWQYHTFCGT